MAIGVKVESRDRILVVCITTLAFTVVEKFYHFMANHFVLRDYLSYEGKMQLDCLDYWCTIAMVLSVIGIVILGLVLDPMKKLMKQRKNGDE